MRYSTPCLWTALFLTPVAACSESHVSSLEPGAPALATRSDQGNVWEPFSITAENPCTPYVDAIDLEGTIHGMGSTWDNGHVKTHYNVSLTGQDAAGLKYQAASTGNGKGVSPETGIEDVVISTVISSQGATDNFVMKLVLHLAADGTVRVENTGEECRG